MRIPPSCVFWTAACKASSCRISIPETRCRARAARYYPEGYQVVEVGAHDCGVGVSWDESTR
jgi:hypothetical protein